LNDYMEENFNFPNFSTKEIEDRINHGYVEVYKKSGEKVILNRWAPFFNNTSFRNYIYSKGGDGLPIKIRKKAKYLPEQPSIIGSIGKAYMEKDYDKMLLILRSYIKPKKIDKVEYIPLPKESKVIKAAEYYKGITYLRRYTIISENETSYKIVNDYGKISWFKKRRFTSVTN